MLLTHRRMRFVFQAILLAELAGAIWKQQWLTAFLTTGIILLTLFALVLHRRFKVFIPPEFELAAIAFVFASLFLGEIRGYYGRFWWWDLLLHTASGFLLGIVGFLLEADVLKNRAFSQLRLQYDIAGIRIVTRALKVLQQFQPRACFNNHTNARIE